MNVRRHHRAATLLALLMGTAAAAHADDAAPKSPTSGKGFQQRVFVSKDGTKLHYWMLMPKGFDANADTNFPYVLCLHGRGGNTGAATVLAGTEMQEKHPCFVVAPAVTRAERWAVPKSFTKLRGGDALPRVLELVDSHVANLPVDADRVYVTGQSMGGFGSFGAIASRPDLFAAAVPVCGGWDPKEAETFAKIPVWAFHGDNDKTVPVEQSRRVVEAMKNAGGTPKLTEYPGVGHNSWTRTYDSDETWTWLFEQRRAKEEKSKEDSE